MKLTDFSELEGRIAEIIQQSTGKRAVDVSIEAEEYVEGPGFLRVVVKIKGSQRLNHKKVAPLVDTIRETVGQVDERFPSVRFQEAA
jgi:hypothetical protein